MQTAAPARLRTLLGEHAGTRALKQGELLSSRVVFDFADVKLALTAFKRVVRDLEFDVAELALMTFLMAKAWRKPLVLLPVVLSARFQHPYLVYNAARGRIAPRDLAGRRVGIRSYSVTTAAWIRGILMNDHGVDPDQIRWVSFEDAHVAEFSDPPMVERAAAGKEPVAMLIAGELDAIVAGTPLPAQPEIQCVFADPAAEAEDWFRRNRAIQINHMVVVSQSLSQSNPDAVREAYRLLQQSQLAAGLPVGAIDMNPFGVEANRRNLEVAIDYALQQRLIPRRLAVDELFDDVTRTLGS